jgi:hypothetical protein
MRVQVERLIRIPIDELREALKKSHGIDVSGVEPYIDGESIVFLVRTRPPGSTTSTELSPHVPVELAGSPSSRSRRRKRRRNRIKTRGWNVVGKITNSQGLSANIYEPFVKAAQESGLSRSELRKVVRQIMVRNGNDPAEDSIDYYLSNTLEFLEKKHSEEKAEQ